MPPPTTGRIDAATAISLLDGLRLGRGEDWRRLDTLYGPDVRHWAVRRGIPLVDAEDVCQEVFVVVQSRIADFTRRGPGSFRAWLREITRLSCLDYFHRCERQPKAIGGTDAGRRLQQVAEAPCDDEDPPEQQVALLHRALALIRCEFPDHYFQAFVRVVADGLTTSEVAVELNIRVLRQSCCRGRARTDLIG